MKYKVTISLKNKSGLNFTEQAPYFNSNGAADTVSFTPDSIEIVAERKKLFNEEDIFYNVQNSLYNQMLKCLQIHYCFEGSKAGITSIKIEGLGASEFTTITRLFDDSFQPYASIDAPIPFREVSLKQLLLEDDDSYALRIIISHWLSQGTASGRQRRLECVWRTFEQLCDHTRHASPQQRSNIAQGLDLMVAHLISNPGSYLHSADTVKSETTDSLRKLRWHDMIANNHSRPSGNSKKTYENYKRRLIDPYTDQRVCTLMQEVLVYRRRELQNYGLYTDICNDLTAKLANPVTNDIDVVAILCYYAYYLRNRLFHGQTLVRVSIFDANQSDEMYIDKITMMLSTLTVELINNYQAL